MASVDDLHGAVPPGPEPQDRLDSWKEIAAYLNRDVRTVQRWEKTARLPVRRHPGGRLRTAYAYRSELDAWWRSQDAVAEPASPSENQHERPVRDQESSPVALVDPLGSATTAGAIGVHPRRRWLAGLAAACAVAALSMATGLRTPGTPAVSPVDSLSVLLLPVDEIVDEPGLAAVVQESVARALTARAPLQLVPPHRIAQALRLMRREPDVGLNEALAREVALRSGGVAWIVNVRLHRVHSGIYVDVHAFDPQEGELRKPAEWRPTDRDNVARAASARAAELAGILAAEPPKRLRGPLAPVTSSSLAAVELYTAALDAGLRGDWGTAESIGRRALIEDPEFAAALGLVGWAMRQQGGPPDEARSVLQSAAARSALVTDREGHLIRGLLHLSNGDLSAAASELGASWRVAPGDKQTLQLLTDLYTRMGRLNLATDIAVAGAELYPDDFHVTLRAAQVMTLSGRDPARADSFAQRARTLLTPQAAREAPGAVGWLTTLPLFRRWAAGEFDATAELDGIRRGLVERLGRERDSVAGALGFAYLAFGRLEDAARAFRHGVGPERQMNLAILALVEDKEEEARRWLLQIRQHRSRRPALFARAGLLEDAQRGLVSAAPSIHAEGVAAVTRGLIEARTGQRTAAAINLRQGLDLLRTSGEPEYFLAAEALAGLALARGERQRAMVLLEMAAAERCHTYGATHWTGGYWGKLNVKLGTMYRLAGRDEDARRTARAAYIDSPDSAVSACPSRVPAH